MNNAEDLLSSTKIHEKDCAHANHAKQDNIVRWLPLCL